ncbi:MAG: hypothetical protein O3C21_11615 [Verrucomicrobia bacterium]|nr:hypothetical protein [Verrucomicrobiota bacterium]
MVQNVAALEFDEVSWGFNGRAVPDEFNLLSVVVRNPGAKPFDGTVTLEQTRGIGRIGGVEVKPCYLEPGGSRVLQFYPRVTGTSNWRLSDGADNEDIEPPREDLPAIVRLIDGDNPLRESEFLRAFPYQRFPTAVGATGGLFAMLADASPEFAPAQKAAFIDWVLAGGRLHVFLNSDGGYPDFAEPRLSLADTEVPVPGGMLKRAIGNGTVTWHGRTVASLTSGEVSALEPERDPLFDQGYELSIDAPLFRELQDLTRIDVAWPMVYLAAIVYIALLGPGHYFWMKRKSRDYRIVLIVLLATVVIFSGLFAYIGRRGYGEKTQASTVSLARHIEGNRYDVTTWGNVFVTKGADYELRHLSNRSLYSTGETYESANATIMNGGDGVMKTEIPVFSSSTFVHRGTLEGAPRPELLTDTGTGVGRTIEWQVPSGFAIESAWVRIQDSVHTAQSIGSANRIVLSNAPLYYPDEDVPVNPPVAVKLSRIGRVLFHRALAMIEYEKPKWVPFLADDAVELYLLTSTPEDFHLTGNQIATRQGATLYRYTYSKASQKDL